VAGLLSLGLAATRASAAPAAVKPDDKWRIVCNHSADSDGVIVFRLTPEGGAPVEFRVEIKKGTRENNVARRIRDVFAASPLSKELYSTETDDGEDVLVKKRRGKPNFALELLSNGVQGLSIKVKLD
jgi:hypothetical protein